MNKWQKEVLGNRVEADEKILKRLKQIYNQAIQDIDDKIAQLIGREDTENLQSIIYQVDYQKALKTQINAILDDLNTKQFTDISSYLTESYKNGFIGAMYDLQNQGIPIISPINQELLVRSLKNNSKLSKGLWGSLYDRNSALQNNLRAEVSRGLSQGYSYSRIAKNVADKVGVGYNNVARIVRTESHRISNEAAMDAQYKAKEAGADIVKQWDATLDGRVRPEHRILDGQIRELDDPFEVNGETAQYPGGFGKASLDVNCRCAILQRARWAVEEVDAMGNSSDSFTKWDSINQELLNFKATNYESFKKAYQDMVDKNQTINDAVGRMLPTAQKIEPKITKDLQEIVGKTHGDINYEVKIGDETKHALDFRLKGGGSLKRKVTTDFVEGKPLDIIEKETYDIVRYTDLTDKDLLVDDYIKVQKGLEEKGYKIVRVKNTLGNKNVAYRGLNTVVEAPNGYKFELQFHTPESIDIKERVHKLYEKQRLDGVTFEEWQRLDKEMIEISSKLPDIKNIDAIKSYNILKGEKPIEVIIEEIKKETAKEVKDWNVSSGAVFKTKEDAIKRFADDGIVFKDSKKYPIDAHLIEGCAAWYDRFSNAFPEFKDKNIIKIPELTMLPPSKMKNGRVLGFYRYYINQPKAIQLALNADVFNNLEKLAELQTKMTNAKWQSGSNIIHTFIHEYGHHVSHSMRWITNNPNFEEEFINDCLNIFKKTHPNYIGGIYKLEDFLSQYGSVEYSECFAEAFAEYFGEEKPREFAKIFGEELEKRLKGLK